MDELRAHAEDLADTRDWPAIHRLRPELEQDRELWPDLWGPLCAIAAHHVGDPQAIDRLSELVDAGFRQPGLFEGELEAAFGEHPQWPDLLAQMEASVGPPPIELLDWPTLTPGAPLGLLDLPEREAELRALIPAPASSAWQTALTLLDWVRHRWRHGNSHLPVDDAVYCLQRVDDGHRFACVEYSLVLSQALNALQIPARRLWLRQLPYHVGLGRGHVVTEAWIDELGRWVVLDSQNGLYWVDDNGTPLGAVELQQRHRSAHQPEHVTVSEAPAEFDAALWFSYFAQVMGSTGSWATGSFGLVFQRDRLATTGRLEHDPAALYPDLSQIGIETALIGDQPALRLLTIHPYATGFFVNDHPGDADTLLLELEPGEHEAAIAVRSPYAHLQPKQLRYRIR